MRSSRVLESGAALWLLAALLSAAAGATELELAEAAQQAIDANLDFAAQRRALGADREEIDLARSKLLPQIDVGVRAQHLEDDRSDGDRGNTTERSLTLAAEISQVLYDENDWADFGIRKHVYDGQKAQLESFRLGVIQDAATAFLELDRAGGPATHPAAQSGANGE